MRRKRAWSPAPVCSTLITRALISCKCNEDIGPGSSRDKSKTVKPESGRMFGPRYCYNDQICYSDYRGLLASARCKALIFISFYAHTNNNFLSFLSSKKFHQE